jgi:hypothetical protein
MECIGVTVIAKVDQITFGENLRQDTLVFLWETPEEMIH